jgi:hypothetical protein
MVNRKSFKGLRRVDAAASAKNQLEQSAESPVS